MCPPSRCCCCNLYQGVRSWSIVFIVLSAIGSLGNFIFAVGLTAYCEDSANLVKDGQDFVDMCYGDDAAAKIRHGKQLGDDDLQYKDTANGLRFSAILALIYMCIAIFGFCAVNKFDAAKTNLYCIMSVVIAGLQAIAGFAFGRNYGGAMIQLLLNLWWCFALKSLADQLRSGQITRENPTGLGGEHATGIQMHAVQMQPGVQASYPMQSGMPMQQGVVMAQATIVQGPVVQATVVSANNQPTKAQLNYGP
jgi:hypothetical protein